jgi:N-acetylglucosaminyl-diphospho-decaprenol L-rhamnosyltransferase
VVCHEGGASTSKDPRTMADAHHASAWRYLSRRYAGPRWLPVRVVLRAGLAARAALARRVPAVAAGAKPAPDAGPKPTR